MRAMKKAAVLLVVLLMICAALTACGSSSQQAAPSSQSEAASEQTQSSTQAGAEKEAVPGKPDNFVWKPDTEGLPDAAGMRVSWDPVPGADGYEYVFYYFWDTDNSVTEAGETAEAGKSMYFQDATNLRMEVRAYRLADGSKVYGEWNASVLPEEDVFRMWDEAAS